MVKKEEENNSIGKTIDKLFNDPRIIIDSCGKELVKLKEERDSLKEKNKELEEEITAKDKGMEYLNGRIDGMEYVIEHVNLKIKEEN